MSTSKASDKDRTKCEKGADHKVRVFVYGTLKKDCGNYSLMQHIKAKFLGYDYMRLPARMVSMGGFPAVCHSPSDNPRRIYGQVFEIEPDALASLDRLEGHPRWYRREKLTTGLGEFRAWIYLMPEKTLIRKQDNVVPESMWRLKEAEEQFWKAREVTFRDKAA